MDKTTTARVATGDAMGQAPGQDHTSDEPSRQAASLRPPRTETIGALLGWLPLQQTLQLLEQEHILDVPPLPDLYEICERTAEYCEQLPPPTPRPGAPTTIALMPDVEAELMRRPTYLREYAPEAQYRVCLVPVHLLITPQWYLNLDFVESLRQRAPRPDDLQGALAFAFSEGVELDDFWYTNGALAISTSSVGQPRINRVEGRRISPHEIEVVVRVQSRPNYLEVSKVGSRLIVVNGIHRAAAMAQAGFDRIPCLLSQVSALSEILPGGLGMIPEPQLMQHERPPYITDYFDPQAAPRFQQRSVSVVARITPQADISFVPAR
jgi:hypothetical protein